MTSVTAHAALLKKKERICVCRTRKSSRSSSWVKTIVHTPQTRLQDVRINLRGRKIRVPQHHLDGAQVGPAFEQVRRKRMADDVRAQRARHPPRRAMAFENLPEPHPAQRAAARVDEQPGGRPRLRAR